MRAKLWQVVGLHLLATVSPSLGQTSLIESSREGDCFRLSAQTTLTGELKVNRDGKIVPVKIVAKNEHTLLERTLSTDKGLPKSSARHYSLAVSRATLDGTRAERSLSAERRLIVAERKDGSLICYSPTGPLTRSDLEVVSEHFETHHLPGVLPDKPVRLGETWKIEDRVVQSLCLFDGLISHEISGKLKDLSGTTATIAIEGAAKGIENGALANLTIAATITFELGSNRIVSVEWKQKDVRDQGPTSPAAEVESTTLLKREKLEQEPGELNAAALAVIPKGNEPTTAMTSLIHRDSAGRYQLLHSRDWFTVAQTEHHLVLRLLERGDFVTQATLTMWKSAGAGKHMAADEFEKLIRNGSGWTLEEVLDRTDVPTDGDRWAYRVTARGELNGTKVVQNFYILASAAGEQMILTFTMKPESANKIGTQDLALLNAIDFPKK